MLIGERNGLLSGLPYDAEVEYLESTGTQWIDTGIVPTDSTSARLVYATLIDSGSESNAIFGSRIAANDSAFSIMQYFIGGVLRLRWDYGSVITNFGKVGLSSGVHTLSTSGNSATIDGVTTVSGGSFVPNGKSIWIFAINNNGAALVPHKGLRVYAFQIWQNSTLVRDFIPVCVGTTGYLYDRVSGRFFGNAGTGSFVVGPDKKTAKDYVQDGLVAMWDAEWNAGRGKHETSPQKWIDISGNGYDLTPTNNIAFGPNSVAISGKTFVGDASVGGKFSVLEAVFASSNGGEGQRVIFFPGSPSYIQEGLYVNTGRLSFNQFPTGYFVAFSSTGIMSVSAHGMPTPSSVLLNGSAASITTNNASWAGEGKITIGSRPQNDLWFNGTLYTLRLYNREFTADEIAANYAVDKARFNLP